MEEKKKRFLSRIIDSPRWFIIIMFFCTSIFIFILVSTPDKKDVAMINKNFKAEELGKIPGIYSWVYKITVDSIDYIVVTKGEAVSIIKHK